MKKTMPRIFILSLVITSLFFSSSALFAEEPVNIHLRIETPTETLFNNSLSVTECQPTPESATSTSAYCALEQVGLPVTWSTWGDQMFLESIGSYSNNAENNSIYWLWLPHYEYTSDAFNKHILTQDERIFIEYNIPLLKLTLGATSISANATTSIFISSFGFDASWNPAWLPAETATLFINSVPLNIASSTFEFGTTTTGTYTFSASKSGYAESDPVVITVTESSTPDENNTGNTNTGSSGGSSTTNTQPSFNTDKAIQYLISQQKPDGSFGSSLYTDWTAIALAGTSGNYDAKEKLKNAIVNAGDVGTSITDYERHAMALMALGVDPRSGTSVDYIKKITDSFDGTQIGDSGIYNDDIFALFPLMKTGYSTSDPVISKTVAFIISEQNSNGSWISVDITAAAIQALSQTQDINGVPEAIARAKEYLKSAQGQSGFGTSYATSWALQAIASLGETPETWQQNSITPLNYLATFQQQDGNVENTDTQNKIWATSYAIPAALGKTWPQILNSFPRLVQAPAPATALASANATTDIASTTASTTQTLPLQVSTATLAVKPVKTATKAVTPKNSPNIASKTDIAKADIQETVQIPETLPNQNQLAAVGSAESTNTPKKLYASGIVVFSLILAGFGIYYLKS